MARLGHSIYEAFRAIAQAVLDFVYPRHCPICELRLASEEQGLCAHCAVELAPYRAEPHHPEERLYACPKFKELLSLYFYEKGSSVQKLVQSFKYKSHTDLVKFFGLRAKQEGYFSHWEEQNYDLVLAIPISEKRRKARGYNQAFLMAKEIANHLSVSVSEDFILHRNTSQSQTRLSKYERITNTEGNFYLNPKYLQTKPPKRVLLVDDVLTTGATLLAVAFLLEKLGIERIDVFTIAVAI